jgi:hypothetical protein
MVDTNTVNKLTSLPHTNSCARQPRGLDTQPNTRMCFFPIRFHLMEFWMFSMKYQKHTKITIFWFITSYNSLEVHWCFERFHLHCQLVNQIRNDEKLLISAQQCSVTARKIMLFMVTSVRTSHPEEIHSLLSPIDGIVSIRVQTRSSVQRIIDQAVNG